MATASAAASSGNVGPGFDVLALSLDLRCHVTAEPAREWGCEQVGRHRLQVGEDLVLRAAKETIGEDRPLHLVVDNHIPLARGLGSSAAAYAAGAAAALRAVGESADKDHIFKLVSDFEGHGDNAAAAVYGGFVGITPDGLPHQLPVALRWRVVGAVPHFELMTAEAREVLPDTISRATAVRTVGRVVALLEGLRSGDRDVLSQAYGDELHELPRSELHPTATNLMTAARDAGASHACWSGAGPTVLAITTPSRVDAVVEAFEVGLGDQGDVWTFQIATEGLR